MAASKGVHPAETRADGITGLSAGTFQFAYFIHLSSFLFLNELL
jgi:hypothetical protein